MTKKISLIIGFICICILIACVFYIQKPGQLTNSNSKIKQEDGIYCLTISRDLYYLSSSDYKVLNKTNVIGGLDMAAVKDKKVYVTIRGNLSKAGKKIAVLRNGQIVKNIELKQILPQNIKYNKFDGKAYIGHILFNNHNYITVINTKNDIVEHVISHNKYIEDFAFSENRMYISSWDSKAPKETSQIYVINLDDYSIIDSFPLDYIATSMIVVDKTIFAIAGLSDEPVLHVLNAENGKAEKCIELGERHPWRVYENEIDGKTYIYVSHYNIDDMVGDSISCIDPETNEVINIFRNAQSAEVLGFNGNDILICEYLNERLSILRNNEIIQKIDLGSIISIAKSQNGL